MRDMMTAAEDFDEEHECGITRAGLFALAREARKHGMRARVSRDHVLVRGPEGAVLATRSAVRLAKWLGY